MFPRKRTAAPPPKPTAEQIAKDRAKQEALLDAVFKRHGIARAPRVDDGEKS